MVILLNFSFCCLHAWFWWYSVLWLLVDLTFFLLQLFRFFRSLNPSPPQIGVFLSHAFFLTIILVANHLMLFRKKNIW
jgi:hypothetical protein